MRLEKNLGKYVPWKRRATGPSTRRCQNCLKTEFFQLVQPLVGTHLDQGKKDTAIPFPLFQYGLPSCFREHRFSTPEREDRTVHLSWHRKHSEIQHDLHRQILLWLWRAASVCRKQGGFLAGCWRRWRHFRLAVYPGDCWFGRLEFQGCVLHEPFRATEKRFSWHRETHRGVVPGKHWTWSNCPKIPQVRKNGPLWGSDSVVLWWWWLSLQSATRTLAVCHNMFFYVFLTFGSGSALFVWVPVTEANLYTPRQWNYILTGDAYLGSETDSRVETDLQTAKVDISSAAFGSCVLTLSCGFKPQTVSALGLKQQVQDVQDTRICIQKVGKYLVGDRFEYIKM